VAPHSCLSLVTSHKSMRPHGMRATAGLPSHSALPTCAVICINASPPPGLGLKPARRFTRLMEHFTFTCQTPYNQDDGSEGTDEEDAMDVAADMFAGGVRVQPYPPPPNLARRKPPPRPPSPSPPSPSPRRSPPPMLPNQRPPRHVTLTCGAPVSGGRGTWIRPRGSCADDDEEPQQQQQQEAMQVQGQATGARGRGDTLSAGSAPVRRLRSTVLSGHLGMDPPARRASMHRSDLV
jgi:hypothetical protein